MIAGDSKRKRVDISVVVPVYNSAATLPALCDRTSAAMRSLGVSYEMILVDDRSPDARVEPVLRDLVAKNPDIVALQLRSNKGQSWATFTGICQATGDYVVTIDDDLQSEPEDIARLFAYLKAHPDCDVVAGVPRKREHSFGRNVGSTIMSLLHQAAFKKPRDFRSSSFRMMARPFVAQLTQYRGGRIELGPLIMKLTRALANVELAHHERAEGQSGYTFWTLVSTAIAHVVNYSSLPLRLIGLIGVSALFLSMGYAGLMFYRAITMRISVPGYSSLVIVVSASAGLILFSIGVIGEYLIRILENTQQPIRPPFHVIRADQRDEAPAERQSGVR